MGYAYVAGKWGTFSVVDVSDVRSACLVGSIVEGVGNAQTVLLSDGTCFFGTNHLLTIGISEAPDSRPVAELRDPRVNRINGMVRCDYLVYATNKSHQIDVFDIDDLANLFLGERGVRLCRV